MCEDAPPRSPFPMKLLAKMRRHHIHGFTLVELLVVIAIMAVSLGLLMSAVQRIRDAGARVACANKLIQIGLALHNHVSIYSIFPPQRAYSRQYAGSSYAYEGIGWPVYILPFIERDKLWQQTLSAYALDPSPWSLPHRANLATVIPAYVCPWDESRMLVPYTDAAGHTAAYTSYVGMTGYSGGPKSGVFGRRPGVSPTQITDGTSNTVMVGERPPPGSMIIGWWYTTHQFTNLQAVTDFEVPADSGLSAEEYSCGGVPIHWPDGRTINMYVFAPGTLTNNCDRYHYWSQHSGGANFLFADGSVRFLSYSIWPHLRDLATIAGGETYTDY